MILQAYDFLELNKKKNCNLQIGGSDQWGNIVNGVELIKRYSNKQAYGLTTPLITLASGAKMGKTEAGAIWLDKKFLSAYDYWQFWRNTDDRDVKKFLNYFTEIEPDEIKDLCEKEKNINKLKIILANEATKILHGNKAAIKAAQTAKDTFEGKGFSSNLPEIKVKINDVEKGIKLLEFLSSNNIISSKSEARRAIDNNGIKINDILLNDTKRVLQLSDFKEKVLKISYGKKRHYIVKIT